MVISLIRKGKRTIEVEFTKGDLPIHAIVYGHRDKSYIKCYEDCKSILRTRTRFLPLFES